MYFLHFEVKEAVEVKMNDGAIEATEVVRFSQNLEWLESPNFDV